MDGIDGIAGGQAIVAALGWLILAFRNDCSWLVWICVLILGSTAGFLSLNWQPAKVFMGDVASGFLGFAFGSISVLYSRHSSSSAAASIFFLWPFVFDGVYTIIRRLFAKEDIFSAHRSHIYQRLVITGLSHSRVSLIYFLISLVCVISVHLWIVYERAAVFPLTVVLSSSFGLLCWVKLRERSSLVASPS
jgi:UDP-N-acetylmuramyl pentapeptide phosphotransferase/UDP-N-acetylglucosamine-1-phosphate transferase